MLREWSFDPRHTMRMFTAEDGRLVLQVRLPLGIEQYELDGRPDGERPHGHETYLQFLEEQLRRHIVTRGSDAGFTVNTTDVAELQKEGVLFYSRYVLLYRLERYDMVLRDTEHNLRLCDLLEQYCPLGEERDAVLQYRPFIIRINAAARAAAIQAGQLSGNVAAVLEDAIARIEALEPVDTPVFQLEVHRSIQHLRELVPAAPGDALEEELERALQEENYEQAAVLRDRIRELTLQKNQVDKER